MNKTKLQGHAAMLVAAFIFGGNFPVTKHLMPEWMSPWGLSCSRFAFGALAFWIVSLFVKSEKVTRRDMLILLVGSLLGVGINQGVFLFGLQLTSSSDAAIVGTIMPILVMIISFFILKEPITFKKTGGVLLGLVGVLLVILTASGTSSASRISSVTGDLLCALSSLMYAFFLVVTREVSKRYSPVTIMKWMFLFTTIICCPFGVHDMINSNLFRSGGGQEWFAYLYLLVGATFLTYLLIPMAQKRIRPTTIGMYNYVQPLVASVLSISIGLETFSWIKPVAAVLIFAGVYFVTTSKSREDVERELAARAMDNKTEEERMAVALVDTK